MAIVSFLRSLLRRPQRAREALLDPALLEETPRRPPEEAFPAALLPTERHHDDPALYAETEHHMPPDDDLACYDLGDDAAL